ncbi:flagellar basal body P-ring formation protein FlgA [Caldichromatium japonicum]|uniref:Flagella basal body P-ring formation protein FlgA n=1 Tax=Caldichromatium japonicum TaxID=2699430 RepID=A0A6G7VDD7_9GAMM|nr:flagellar basal body P-ring formation chaperone FlgA [Caldichromatium japonicum]QIK37984.1 flagellar basal body P-ring formation protein FlgA [Caldichromatium japonicum]
MPFILSEPERTLRCMLVPLLAIAAAVQAEPDPETESIARIRETARVFAAALADDLDGEIEIEVGQLDNRLQLTRCAQPPTAQLAPGARREGQTTVQIRCAGPVSWSLFIPVRIERYRQVVVLDRPIERHQVIGPGDIRIERQAVSSLSSGYFSDPQSVIGLSARRRLSAGQVLIPAHLDQPVLIKRGQEVTLYVSRPGLVVQMKGVALEDGRAGERIRVRNLSSKRVVEGHVESADVVRITVR